jgi:integrase
MQRDWSGSVFLTPGRDTYSAKFLDFDSGAWRVRKGLATKAEARDFLDQKRREFRAKGRGDFDHFAEQRRRPIAEHVADFIEHVRSGLRRRPRKRPDKHVGLLKSRLDAAFIDMGTSTLAELTLDKATRFLNRLLDSKHVSTKTRNDYAAALKQFGRWGEEGNRLAKSPLAALRKVRDDSPGQRQDLPAETVNLLAAGAIQRVRQRSEAGNLDRDLRAARRRALTVLIAFLAGLRNNELACLRWSMVESDNGLIALPAAITKSGREEFVPLHDGLGELLQAVRKERGIEEGRTVADSELVVGYLDAKGNPTLPVHLAERIREDAEWIKHPIVDSAGRRLDLHSMRTSFANELDRRGVPDGITGDLMRHKPATVTRRNYVRRDAERLRPFINVIPAETAHVAGLLVGEPRGEPKALRTGEPERASVSSIKAV